MIPLHLENLFREQRGGVDRQDQAKAIQALQALGVRADTQFGQFYLAFSPINFMSPHSKEELLDVSHPTAQILRATDFIREVWDLPSEYVCITTAEGEGAYLYSTVTKQVYNFSLQEREDFLRHRPPPIASDFFGFLQWYLEPEKNDQV